MKEETCPSCGVMWVVKRGKIIMIDEAEIKSMMRSGLTIREIAKKLKLSINVVAKALSFNGDGNL